jgi:hypothetical protein
MTRCTDAKTVIAEANEAKMSLDVVGEWKSGTVAKRKYLEAKARGETVRLVRDGAKYILLRHTPRPNQPEDPCPTPR